ncbi:MAG: hypothetical protein GY813_15260 [Halieaceae bacterium]|nr:hypothetical protein [Halieaceae bacterium]
MLDTDLVKKTPLLVHLVFHPESTSAGVLAKLIHVACQRQLHGDCFVASLLAMTAILA